MVNFEDQKKLFETIGTALKEKTECIAIGGSAMMFYNLKVDTKDVDLVFIEKKYFNLIKEALHDSGFKEKDDIKIFSRYEVAKTKPLMMIGRETRFDLFFKEVICFEISPTILERIKEVHEFNNLIIKVIIPEDIILLKCATERRKDRDDVLEIIKNYKVDWDIVIQESLNQIKLNKPLFPVFLYEFLQELKEDLDAEIPKDVLKRLRKISEEVMIKRLKERSYKKL